MALPNTIELTYDDDHDGGTTPEVTISYSRFDESVPNRSEYISEEHTIALRDKLNFFRTFPKASGNFRGMAKTAVKTTKDVSVAGVDQSTTNVAPSIITTEFSFPVGMTSAARLEQRMRHIELLLDETIMVPLTDQQMI